MIHFVHLTSQPGGIEVLLPKIIENLSEKAIQCFVVRPPLDGQANVYEGKDITLLYGSHKNRKAVWKLWKYARSHQNELFHVFNIGPLNLLILRLAGVKKLIYSVHGTIYWKNAWEKQIRKPFWKLALSKNYRVIANSRYSRDCFRQAMAYKKEILVGYNPFSSDTFHPIEKKVNGPLKISYCGRLAPGKNILQWLEVAAKIHSQNIGVQFFIYGSGPLEKSLQKYVKDLELMEVIHFMGYRKNIAEAYQSADMMLFISEYESFGNVAVESILCGTPIIVSDIPSMREIFEHYPEFIVPLDDTLQENILSKIGQFPKMKAATLKARAEFKDRFGQEQHIATLEQLYASFN